MKKNKLFLLLVIFLSILAMGFVATYLYLNSNYFKSNIKLILSKQLENLLDKKIEFGTIDSVSLQSIQLTNLTVIDNTSNDGNTIFQAENAEAKFSLFLPFFNKNEKDWQLVIKEIIFYGARIDLTRDINGDFNLVKYFSVDPESLDGNIVIKKVSFENSFLQYHDQSVYNYAFDYLTTGVKKASGFFDLTQLPEIRFNFKGVQDNDDALLSLSGSLFIGKPEYSLDFQLQNADITHFQYYLETANQFGISQGKFDLNLNLSSSPDVDNGEIFWQGKTTFFQTDISPHFLNSIPIEQSKGSIHFVKPEINIEELDGLYHSSNIQLKGQVLIEPELYFDLSLVGKDIDASLLKDDIYNFIGNDSDINIEGAVNLSGNINGLSDLYSIEGKAESSSLIIDNIPFSNISSLFSLNNDGLTIKELKTDDLVSSIAINGNLDWYEEKSSFQLNVTTLNLSLNHPIFQQTSFLEDIRGNINSNLRIESNKENISIASINGSFSINNLKRDNLQLDEPVKGNINTNINLENNTLTISECELQSGNSSGFFAGTIEFEELIDFMLSFKMKIPDLKTYSSLLDSDWPISGNVSLQGELTGNSNSPEIFLDLELTNFSMQDIDIDEFNGKMVYKNNNLSVQSFSLASQQAKINGNGEVSLTDPNKPEILFSYQFSPQAIEPLLSTLGYQLPISTQVDGSGIIEGTWPELKVVGDFGFTELVYQDYLLGGGNIYFHIESEQPIDSKETVKNSDNLYGKIIQNYSINIDHLQLKNADMDLNAKGMVKLAEDYPFSLKMELSHQKFKEMIEHFYVAEEDLKVFLPSKISGKVNCSGNIEQQEVLSSFQLFAQQEEDNTPSNLNVNLAIDREGFNISDFQLVQSEGTFQAAGKIKNDGQLDIDFQTSQLDISTLMSLIQIDEEIEGIVDIDGTAIGTIKKPVISLTAQIKKGFFREFNYENLQGDLVWNSQTNQVEVKSLSIYLEDEYQIFAQGKIPVTGFFTEIDEEKRDLSSPYSDIPLDFQINMEDTDLNILKALWKDTFSETNGTVSLDLSLSGTAGDPLINGSILINKGIVHFKELPIQVEEMNNKIDIIDNKVIIPDISFSAYENHFNITGGFKLINFLPEDISFLIKNKDSRIAYQNILDSEYNLELYINDSITSPHINGQISLSKGILDIDNLLHMEGGLDFTSPSSTTFNNNSKDQLDISINILDSFKLKMKNAEAEVAGKISLNGLLSSPEPNGTISLKKGYFLYFDKKFSILDGLVTINGLDTEKIELNARATTTVQGVQVNINALGNLSNPIVLLSSQPPLKETEIISLLTFDRNIEGLSEGEVSQLLSQEMANILFQSLQLNLFKKMEREIAEGLGLEFLTISFDTPLDRGSYFLLEDLSLADLTLEVGKNFGDDLSLTYSTPLDFHGDASLSLDYKLSPQFTFSAQLENFSLNKEDYKIRFGLEIRF